MNPILLNPGPVTLSARVRAAMSRPDLCHREVEFAALQDGLREKLLKVYDLAADEWASILLTGSGTAAVEAMVTSCVPDKGRLLVIENGVYGERMSRIAGAYGIATERVSFAWDAAMDLGAIENALDAGAGGITHVAAVQHETTTGRLNDIEILAALCKRAEVRLLLDGVSSFGAEAIDFDGWPIDACAATANKCLHGVPGTAFVIVRRAALGEAITPRSVYLDLHEYLLRQDAQGTPFTQSIQTFYALDEALDEFFEAGGWRSRQALFTDRLASIRATLLELGVKPLLDDVDCSCVLHAFELPEGRTYEALHRIMKSHGFIIYAGQGALSKRVFRIAAMGDIGASDLERLHEALTIALNA